MPIGIQDFESLRRDNYIYVDKTQMVWQLANTGRYYFLSRPRRFGKSLLVSTLKAYFLGKRHCFEGLWLGAHEEKWEEYPVFHLDLNGENYNSLEALERKIDAQLKAWEQLYPTGFEDYSLGIRFSCLIECAAKKCGRGAVILIDEYDKPLLQQIDNVKLQDEMRDTLKGFFSVLKSQDAYIRFALITGVTRFSKVSIFSDLNNLNDITLLYDYHNICGFTEQEVLTSFSPYIDRLAERNEMTREECIANLRKMYDGYHFHQRGDGLYNPFSLIRTFSCNEFGYYWFESGTPSYLIRVLKRHEYSLNLLQHSEVMAKDIRGVDADARSPIPLILQSGYLTIKGYDSEFQSYILDFPNEEVERGFVDYVAPYYIFGENDSKSSFDIREFVRDVRAGRAEQFCRRLKALFADTPYELIRDLENHYQNIVWVLFKLLGFYTQAEYHTSEGRIDLLVKTADYIYVVEFKLDGTAEEALAQISDRQYTLPFTVEQQRIFRIGINFSRETRNVEKCLAEG